jgi:xanthine dehydrogenase molybdenum-binding subunit
MLSQVLEVPNTRIRVLKMTEGGAFGNKLDLYDETLACLLARKAGQPVKIEYSRKEEFHATRHRHAFVINLKTGVKKDGTIAARYMRAVVDTGAYAPHGPAVTAAAGGKFGALYNTPHLKYEGFCVYTNTPVSGAYRGYGNPQPTFAVESQMDIIAEKIGIDPIELRRKNARLAGDIDFASGTVITSCGLEECFDKGAALIGWKEKRGKRARVDSRVRGVGMARYIHPSCVFPHGPELSSCVIKLNEDGTATLITGTAEGGSGSSTALAQIVAEVLGLKVEAVNMIEGDTDTTPYDPGHWASHTVYVAGNAARIAAEKVRRQLLARAAGLLGCRDDELGIKEGKVYSTKDPECSCTVGEVVKNALYDPYGTGEPLSILASASFHPTESGTGFGACFAEVEVDTETGRVEVLDLVALHDVGTAINPLAVEGQLEGGVVQALGYTLQEEWHLNNGAVANASFVDYKVPRALDIPAALRAITVDTVDTGGPFGAKGVGEVGVIAVAPAVANAIYDATGVRIRELPVTAERLYWALRAGEKI